MEKAQGLISQVIENEGFYLYVPFPDTYLIEKREITECEVGIDDGRTIRIKQRKKAYALLRDIADWSGHVIEYLKDYFKADFIAENGGNWFSLSDTDVTTARGFIDHMVHFCLKYGIPCQDTLLNQAEDISKYLYYCLLYRRCAICGRPADVHHIIGSKIGMGGNRKTTHHLNRECVALCRIHHGKAHNDEVEFFNKWHIYGIKLDSNLCEKLNLRK